MIRLGKREPVWIEAGGGTFLCDIHAPAARIAVIQASAAAKDLSPPKRRLAELLAELAEVVQDWREVEEEDGTPAAFSAETLDVLLRGDADLALDLAGKVYAAREAWVSEKKASAGSPTGTGTASPDGATDLERTSADGAGRTASRARRMNHSPASTTSALPPAGRA